MYGGERERERERERAEFRGWGFMIQMSSCVSIQYLVDWVSLESGIPAFNAVDLKDFERVYEEHEDKWFKQN